MSRLEKLLKLAALTPDDADLPFMIAQEHLKAEGWAEALHYLGRYTASEGDVGAGWALAATCHERLGDLPAAAEALRSGIANARANGHAELAGELEDRLEELE